MDDTMFMSEPSIQEDLAFKHILNNFMLASHTKIHPNKSQVFFFNTNPSIQSHFSCILGFSWASFLIIYHGVTLKENSLKTIC